MALIHEKIPAVMSEIDAIGKNRKNTQGSGYNFRGIDDVYNELHSILSKHKVFTVPEVLEERTEERVSKSGGNLIYRILRIKYTFFAEDGSCVIASVIGEAMDSGDKAANKSMSVAHKYCLLQVFAIPTEEDKDPENESPAPLPKKDQVQYITESQVRLLNTEISKRDIDREKFKQFLKLDSLKDISVNSFESVLDIVRKKPLKQQREPGEEIE